MGRCIYIFSNSYKPVLGGIQTVSSQLAETLIKKGEKCRVITCLYPKTLKIRETVDGVDVFRFPFSILKGSVQNNIMYFVSLVMTFILFLINRPKAVYVHFPLCQTGVVYAMKKVFNFKLITCFHGHDVLRHEEGESKDSAIYKEQKQLIDVSDKVTACSKFLAEKVESVFNCSGVKSIYNGVDLSRFSRDSNRPEGIIFPYLFAFGRLEKIKGYDLLIEAFAKARINQHIHLVIAGDGSQKKSLQKQIQDFGLSDRVLLIGRLSPNDIVRYSKHAEINVIPSLREPFGIVALEAIAAKRPVIATKAGGLPEVVDPKYGILCEPSVTGLKEAIEKTLTSGSFCFSEVDEYLNKFSIPAMVTNYQNL